jgi:hypothetical protein
MPESGFDSIRQFSRIRWRKFGRRGVSLDSAADLRRGAVHVISGPQVGHRQPGLESRRRPHANRLLSENKLNGVRDQHALLYLRDGRPAMLGKARGHLQQTSLVCVLENT